MRRGTLGLVLACAGLAATKLWLIHDEEIVARDYPFDDPWYVVAAEHMYWGAPYTESALLRQAATPLWIAAVRPTGVPLRIAMEILLLAAAGALTAALLRAGFGARACTAAFAAIAFHPFSIENNDYVRTESLYTPTLLLALACLIVLLVERERCRTWQALAAGLALALLWHTRQEHVLLAGAFLVFAALLVLLHRAAPGTAGGWRALARPLLLPALVALVGVFAVRAANRVVYGVFAETDLSAPGYVRAYRALVGIEPAPPLRFVPVPREVRARAYSVSPRFRELRPHLEGSVGAAWAQEGEYLGVRDEIAAGWFMFALREAAGRAGRRDSGPEAERFFHRVAEEIDAACADGRLRCRFVPVAMLDPHLPNWLPHLPGSLVLVAGQLLPSPPSRSPGDRSDVRPEIRRLFDQMANRRPALVSEAARTSVTAARRVQALLWRLQPPLLVALGLAAAAALVGLALSRAKARRQTVPWAVVVLLTFVVVERLLFLAVVDASAYSIRYSDRFVYPVMGLSTCVPVLIIGLAGRALRDGAGSSGDVLDAAS